MRQRWLTPLAIILALAGLAVGAALSVPHGPPPAPPTAVATFASDDPDLGRRTYVFCQACHGADGRGVPGYAPALAGSRWLTGDPRAAAAIVLHGYDATSEPGAAYVSAKMLGHAGQLADHEIAAVLTWARRQWGNDAPPFAASVVAGLRQRFPGRTTAWTPAGLRALIAEP